MNVNIDFIDDDGNKKHFSINTNKFHEMIFISNALEDGWTIKKKKNSYFFF